MANLGDLRVGRGVVIPAAELRFRFSRSGGPGGQNVNKRATRAELVFDLASSGSLTPDQKRRASRALSSRLDSRGRVRVTAQASRTQAQNRAQALEALRDLLADALRPPPRPRRPTAPTKAARERRLAAKKARSEIKRRRAAPLAERD